MKPAFHLLIRFFAIISILIFSRQFAAGQAKIYLENEVKEGSVVEISDDKIKYKNPLNPGPIYSVSRSRVKAVFNETGDFLIIGKLDSLDALTADNLIKNFIKAEPVPSSVDMIYTLQKKILECTILSENTTAVQIKLNDFVLSIEKANVVMLRYRNGKHSILANIDSFVSLVDNKVITASEPIAKKTVRIVSQPAKVVEKPRQELKSAEQPIIDPKSAEPTAVASVGKEGEVAREVMPEEKKVKHDAALEEQRIKEAALMREKRLKREAALEEQRIKEATILEEKQIRKDSIAAILQANRQYQLSMLKAETFFKNAFYDSARNAYALALEAKPSETEPIIRIDTIDRRLAELKIQSIKSNLYDSLVSVGDSLMINNDWPFAIDAYHKALDIKPNEYYAQKQIKYLQAEQAKKEEELRLKEEQRKKEEAEKRYKDALVKADAFVKEKKYEEALELYNEALQLHPENEFAQARVKILTYQISKQKENSPIKN